MTPGLVSVIVPVHNRGRLLLEAVGSALTQDHRPLEVIVVDDGSTDDTGAVADGLADSDDLVRVIHQEQRGVGGAREAGRLAASGEFLQYLDSDDLLLAGKLSAQVAGLRARPDCGVSYGWTRYRDATGIAHPVPWKDSGTCHQSMFPAFLVDRWWDTPTPLYRSELCRRAGPWLTLTLEEDWEYDCRIASFGTRLHYVPQYVAEVRDHSGDRLCRGDPLDPSRLAQRASAQARICEHARRAGLSLDLPEVQHFARALFLLARQCGAAGLRGESQRLFRLSRQFAGPRGRGRDYLAYRSLAALLGWERAGALASLRDRLRLRWNGEEPA